jgi:hypothetical protein
LKHGGCNAGCGQAGLGHWQCLDGDIPAANGRSSKNSLNLKDDYYLILSGHHDETAKRPKSGTDRPGLSRKTRHAMMSCTRPFQNIGCSKNHKPRMPARPGLIIFWN